MLLLGFCKVPLAVMEVLGVTCPQAPPTLLIKVDENVNVVIREVESPLGLTSVSDSFGYGYGSKEVL